MALFRPRSVREKATAQAPSTEAVVARLTAKADLIVDELSDVVKQMGDMLRKKYEDDD